MLESLLYPHSVAVIGASRNPGKVGYELVANLIKGGFAGELVLVNPTAPEIMGHRCFSRLEDYKGTVELSVVATPVPDVAAAVRSSLDKGARAVVVITAGFREVGSEGAALERTLEEMCSAHSARLLGPNCLGVINTAYHLNASFAAQMPERGSISVVSQSGALCAALLDWLTGRRVGLAKMISIGNKADLDETDILEALCGDSETHVIVGHLESIVSGEAFVRAAELVSAVKPVVMLKAGTTAAGSRAASSHTGGLAGADIAYGAAFKRCGVIRAETFEALLDYALAFSMQPLPAGKRVAIITNAGGPGIMAADAVERSGLSIAVLSVSTATALRAKLPAAASVANPIDVLGDADPERYAEAVKAA
jgi:acetate---CoA ligase (ADP-forming)